jgi:hypothetical protein
MILGRYSGYSSMAIGDLRNLAEWLSAQTNHFIIEKRVYIDL